MTTSAGYLVVAPVVLPLAVAAFLLVTGSSRPRWRAPVSIAASAVLALLAAALVALADVGPAPVAFIGDWPAPYGIVLVADRLGALMVGVTAMVGFAAALAASPNEASRGPHFHAFLQVELAGLCGAFLTADLFNLFVFFEVLLIASYALLLNGGSQRAMRPGLRYVAVNLVASSFFLVGVAAIYAACGTLNLADLARRLPMAVGRDQALARAGLNALVAVFACKAALLPLGFWLSPTYRAAGPAVAVVFAVMTKVGVVAILRILALASGSGGALDSDAGPSIVGAVYVAGLATVLAGGLASLAARDLSGLVAALVGVSSGVLVAAIATDADAWAGAIAYLAHSTIAIAFLFLVAGAIGAQRGGMAGRLAPGPATADPVLLGALWLIGAVAAAGLPPLGGFVGKFLVLRAVAPAGARAWLWVAILASGGFALIALARAGSTLFWAVNGPAVGPAAPPARGGGAALVALALATLAFAPFAGHLARYVAGAALDLRDPGSARFSQNHRPAPASIRGAPR